MSVDASWQYPAGVQNSMPQSYDNGGYSMSYSSPMSSSKCQDWNPAGSSKNSRPTYLGSPLLSSMQMMSGDNPQQQQQPYQQPQQQHSQSWPQQSQQPWSSSQQPMHQSMMMGGDQQQQQQMHVPIMPVLSAGMSSSPMSAMSFQPQQQQQPHNMQSLGSTPMVLSPWQQWQVQQQMQQLNQPQTNSISSMPLMMTSQPQRAGQTLYYPGQMNAYGNNGGPTMMSLKTADGMLMDAPKKAQRPSTSTAIMHRSAAGSQMRNKSSLSF